MDFINVNLLNVRINAISGNLLPLTSGDSIFPITLRIYGISVWLLEVLLTCVSIPGLMMVSREQAMRASTITCVVIIEVFFISIRFYTRRKLLSQLIQKLNEILSVADDTMKSIVTTTLKPMQAPLMFYMLGGSLSIAIYFCIPFLLLHERDSFFYEDYTMPAVFSKQPFSSHVFLMGTTFLLISNTYIFLKKGGLDVYTIHLVLLITAQYRYISTRLATIFRDGNPQIKFDESLQGYYPGDRWVEKEIKALCRHYNTVIHLSSMLKKLLSLNCTLVYLDSVFRFCFIGVLLAMVLSSLSPEGILVIIFASGSVVQFYMLCSCIQQLLDASRGMTDKAFNEKWYEYGLPVKRTFMLMILGNNLECKLSSCNKFNLSLPSFMTILNQSYSIALLFLRVK